MGLDMYIYKRKFAGSEQVGGKTRLNYQETKMLYLRKANQIHKYIVDGYADGADECQQIFLSIDDIKELKKICERVIKNSKIEDGWVYYTHSSSHWLDETEEVELAERKGDRFERTSKRSAMELSVGDYIYGNDHYADKVESIEKRDGRYLVYCGGEFKTKVIANPTLASELLPTEDGFFFGDTHYTEDYIKDLELYVKQANEIIADYEAETKAGTNEDDIDYYYRASW